jgi:transposase
MARAKLAEDEIVTLRVLKRKGHNNSQIAQTLGISEAAVRYHLRRPPDADGRKNKPRKADDFAHLIDAFLAEQAAAQARPEDDQQRPVNLHALHDWLQAEHSYQGSYKSVLRFVRARYPRPPLRPFRRVETPPGAQAQVDWGDFQNLDVGQGKQTLHAFVLVLSHSRKQVLVWSLRMDQLSWHKAHNLALQRLGGVPAVLRIDNLKTGIAHGAGPWGEVNDAYRAYARALGFHVDACLPRCPRHKGKVENKVKFVKRRLRLQASYAGLEDLQRHTDEQLERGDDKRLCPVSGLSVQQTFLAERLLLRPLPLLPEPFDLVVSRPVQRDCTISFEGRTYSVPFRLCGLTVEVRGCCAVVQVCHRGQVVAEHPRQSQARLLIEPSHYRGEGDERVCAPQPVGKMGQRLQEILDMPVEQRPMDLYAALAEVAR